MPTVAQAFRLILQEENHKEFANSGNSDSMAFLADKRNFNAGNSSYGNSGNVKNNSQRFYGGNNTGGTASFGNNIKRNVTKPGANYYCTNCKVAGNIIERCFKIHGFPPNFKNFKNKKIAAVSQTVSENSQSGGQEQSNSTISVD